MRTFQRIFPAFLLVAILGLSLNAKNTLNHKEQEVSLIEEQSTSILANNDPSSECYEFVFPIDVKTYDGKRVSVKNITELETVEFEWLEKGSFEEAFDVLVFPLKVKLKREGTIKLIASKTEFDNLVDVCYDKLQEDENVDCIQYVFPYQIKFPNGTKALVHSEEELEKVLEEWNASKEKKDDLPVHVFPLKVKLFGEEIKTVESEKELDQLYIDCFGEIDFDNIDCYELVFPMKVVKQGKSIDVNSDSELDKLYQNFEEGAEIEFVYPIKIKKKEGSTVIVNSEEELIQICE